MKALICRIVGHTFATGVVVVDMSKDAHKAYVAGGCSRCGCDAHAENVPVKYYNIPERKIITPGMETTPPGGAPKLELLK